MLIHATQVLDLDFVYMIDFEVIHQMKFHGFIFEKVESFLFVFRGAAFVVTTFYTKNKIHPDFCSGEDLFYTSVKRYALDPEVIMSASVLFSTTITYGEELYPYDKNAQLAIIDWIFDCLIEHSEIDVRLR